MSANDIQEKIWDLKNRQSECGLIERAAIQAQIIALYAMLDAMNK